jgi:predicted amidohydrolase YtcJ
MLRGSLIACAVILALPARAQSAAPADFVFRGGTVYTADSAHPRASAAAVTHGRITYVGDDAGAAKLVGAKTVVIELRGRMLLPGFEDSHVHPASGGVALGECKLELDTTRAMVLAKIAKCAKETPGTGWLRGRGWQLPVFPHANPSRQLLDSVVPDRPAYFRSADGHGAWANTKALEIAGITAATPDPPRGRIERDASGAPSGTLRESAADLVARKLPARTWQDYVHGLRRSMALANRLGITSLTDADADTLMMLAYVELDSANELTTRIMATQATDAASGAEQVPRLVAQRARFTVGHVRATAAKIYADGVIEAKTAALLEPYVGTDDRGPAERTPGSMDSLVTALDRAGFQVHIHAIGDRAVRISLDAFEAARAANGTRDSRHQIAHLEMIDTLDVPRFATLGVLANFQPLWAYRDSYVHDLTEPVIGPERSSRLYPLGSVARTGGTIVAGSDWNVSSINPLEAIQVAVTRRDPDGPPGPPWLPAEVVSLDRILAAYTIVGARANFQEHETGSITVGKAADLIVLDHDLTAISPFEIHATHVLLTMLEGRVVFGDVNALRGR